MRIRGLFGVLGVLAGVVAPAAVGGVISGTVKEVGTGMPVADVAVTAASPSLGRETTVVTDAHGVYRIPGLPPGHYRLLFEKELFRSYARQDVPLREGYSLRLDVSLVPEVTEALYLDRGPPTVDTRSTTRRQLSYELGLPRFRDMAASAPGVGRSAESLAQLIPGVRNEEEGLSFHGSFLFENEYLLDGLSTRDAVLGLNALSLDAELLSKFDVVSGGLAPESGPATGGLVELLTRTGSNDLHGSVFAFWTPRLLEGRRASSGVPSQDAFEHPGDFGATLGGPVRKDTLWFFAGVTPVVGRDAHSLQALGKLTYLIHSDHYASLTFITAPSSQGDTSTEVTRVAVDYHGAALDRWVQVDANAGWLSQRVSPGAGGSGDRTLDRYQARALATLWLTPRWGTHLLKAGVDAERLVHERAGSRSPSNVFGGFVQDTWSFLNRFTLNAGARYDVQRLEGTAAGPASVTSARLSPRVGLVIDPWANGRLKVFAHYGKLQGLIPLGLLDAPALAPDSVADVTLDPELGPMAVNEVLTGLETELTQLSTLGATYTHRKLDRGFALVPQADGSGAVLSNPGQGLLVDSPRATRAYHAVTVELRRNSWSGGWQGRVSYTWSKLTGNPVGPFAVWDGLEPAQRLPLDRPHAIRAQGMREFLLDPTHRLRADVGASYLGASGMPLDGSGKRTPWMQSLDVFLGMSYLFTKDQRVSVRIDAFNVLNFQEATHAMEGDTGLVPVRYQPPRQVRLGVRYGF